MFDCNTHTSINMSRHSGVSSIAKDSVSVMVLEYVTLASEQVKARTESSGVSTVFYVDL